MDRVSSPPAQARAAPLVRRGDPLLEERLHSDASIE